MPIVEDRKRIAALIKWGETEHLKSLLSGSLHLNPPEYFRMNPGRAFGDRDESCGYSYRSSRDAKPPKLIIAGKEVDGVTSITAVWGGGANYYLHCWSALTIPRDTEELASLKRDVQLMRDEFGPAYVVLPANSIRTFLERIMQSDREKPICDLVDYRPDRNLWGPLCKDSRFSHQREFRFLIGKCGVGKQQSKQLAVGTLRDIMKMSPTVEIIHDKERILLLDETGVY